MNITIKQDPSADWTSRNPVLDQFCLGYETDTGKAKLGDGVTAWSSLGYFAPDGGAADLAATVRATTLTGLSAGSNQAIADTDTILEAFENVQAQIDGVGGAVSPLTLTSNGVSEVPLTIELAASQTADALQILNSADAVVLGLSGATPAIGAPQIYFAATSTTGLYGGSAFLKFAFSGVSRLDLDFANNKMRVDKDAQLCWSNSAANPGATNDVGLARNAAGILKITDASSGGGSLQLQEVTAPSAPATNNVVLYAEDNGSGKTRLMALFATGAAQQVAIEP